MPDNDSFAARTAFEKVRNAENNYSIRLKKLARYISDLSKEVTSNRNRRTDYVHLEEMLTRYAYLIKPWAESVASRFVEEVVKRDAKAWKAQGRNIAPQLNRGIATAPIDNLVQVLQAQQVEVIQNVPLQAAKRLHTIAIENLSSSEETNSIKKSGLVTASQARLIARNETGKVSLALAQARAPYIGSDGYIWCTVKDERVRPSHFAMEGVYVNWNQRPEIEPGKFCHVSEDFGCRCYPAPVISDRYS